MKKMVKSKKANSCFDFKNKIKKILKSKCSQANVIVIILIIFISITTILIFWNILNPFIKEKSKEVEAKGELLTVNINIKEAILFVTGASKVSVRRGVGKGEIDELKFVFYDEKRNSHVETRKSDLEELETEIYSFSPIQNFGKIKSVSVFPVIKEEIGIESEEKINKIFEIPRGLISWWRFDDERDFVNGNNCNVVSIVKDSEREKVAGFNEGSFVNCGNNNLSINKEMAISFWIKTNAEHGVIIKKGNGNKNYEVSLSKGKINFSYTTKGVLKERVSNFKINDGKWRHVILSKDWGGDEYLRVYKDSTLEEIISLPKEFPDTNTENFLVGNFNGFIDELMFFNEDLSISEVEGLFSWQK